MLIESILLRLFQRRFGKHLCQTGLVCDEFVCHVCLCLQSAFYLENFVTNRNKQFY